MIMDMPPTQDYKYMVRGKAFFIVLPHVFNSALFVLPSYLIPSPYAFLNGEYRPIFLNFFL